MTETAEEPEGDDYTAVLERQLILDLVPCDKGQQAIGIVGLNPASPDGAEIEHIMSHARIDQIESLSTPLHVYSALVAEIWTKLFINTQPEGMIPENMHGQIFESQATHIYQAMVAILANMFDMGLLRPGEAYEESED